MTQNKEYMSVGIDVCKGKWIAVCITENQFEVDKYDSIKEICDKYSDSDSIIIDMPLGLPEDANDVRPECEARKHLKGKASSIFNVPCRQAVYAKDYESANEINREILGVGLSKQSFGICSKIREVDEFFKDNPEWKNKLLEGHPEICFSKLNNGKAILENKTKSDGQMIRLEILTKYYSKSDLVINKFLSDVPARKKLDDVIDALCLATTGLIGLKYKFKIIPDIPMEDKRDIKMQMIYGEEKDDSKIVYTKLVRDKVPEIIKYLEID